MQQEVEIMERKIRELRLQIDAQSKENDERRVQAQEKFKIVEQLENEITDANKQRQMQLQETNSKIQTDYDAVQHEKQKLLSQINYFQEKLEEQQQQLNEKGAAAKTLSEQTAQLQSTQMILEQTIAAMKNSLEQSQQLTGSTDVKGFVDQFQKIAEQTEKELQQKITDREQLQAGVYQYYYAAADRARQCVVLNDIQNVLQGIKNRYVSILKAE
ncbi:Hypothetical_protein [Hexamita inflata]|uniref:Hypothetical_protein n=1 Tax=Hexamita inflata TaxID=28002 RepID=A0ABP1HHE9_9EUKA